MVWTNIYIYIYIKSAFSLMQILRYNHGQHHFCSEHLTCNMFDPISLSLMQISRKNLDFSSTNILRYHFSPRPWCTWFTIFVIMSALLYCPVTCMSGHDKCEITQFNGRITCWNFYICILWDWTCLPRPSFNNKTLAPSHSNPFVAMLKGFSVTAMKYLFGDTFLPGDKSVPKRKKF